MIYSMTAYANANIQKEWGNAKWEIKSVNHRYLELSFKLPERLRSLESSLRELSKNKVQRGKVECWLHLGGNGQEDTLKCNHPLVKQLAVLSAEIQRHFQNTDVQFQNADVQTTFTLSPLEVLRWPEVLTVKEIDLEAISHDILSSFDSALINLLEQRAREGDTLRSIILERLQEMADLIKTIQGRIPYVIKTYREKMSDRLNELKTEINLERFEQEMVYFLQKMDVTEELDRLSTHIQASQDALQKGGVIGRHLDFLMQELNRETNTLASKSTDIDIIQKTVELKVLIEKIREQVQNLE